MNKICLLENTILDYPWGSCSFIPEFISKTPPFEKPQAEMWMGSHKKAPSKVVSEGTKIPLDQLIGKYPEAILGAPIAKKFSGELPFLFKVLSASKPLSIQTHPNKNQAILGFNRENSKGIAIDAPERNYKDYNHKPELICALTVMWALKGFRPPAEILKLFEPFENISGECGIEILNKQPDAAGIRKFFLNLLNIDTSTSIKIMEKVIKIIKGTKDINPVHDWIIKLNQEYPGDIGALSPLYLNLIKLNPGDAVFLPACELHAYLSGSGLEIMANSDNVLRGGLTQKHIDKTELMNVLSFNPAKPETISGKKAEGFETFFHTAAEEFILSYISLSEENSIYKPDRERGVEIILCTEGSASITDISSGQSLDIKKGTSMLIPAAVKGYILKGKAAIYKASVPLPVDA